MAGVQRTSRPRTQPPSDEFVTMRLYERDRDDEAHDRQELKTMVEEIRHAVYNIVPRTEHERIWSQTDSRFNQIESKLDANYRELDSRLNATSRRTDDKFLGNASQSTYLMVTLIIGVVSGLIGHFVH